MRLFLLSAFLLTPLALMSAAHATPVDDDPVTQKAKMILSLRRFVSGLSADCEKGSECERRAFNYIRNYVEDPPAQNWEAYAPQVDRLHRFGLAESMCSSFDSKNLPDSWISKRIRCFRAAVKALSKDVIVEACEPDVHAKPPPKRDAYAQQKLQSMNKNYYETKEDIANCYADHFEYHRRWIQKQTEKGGPIGEPPRLPRYDRNNTARSGVENKRSEKTLAEDPERALKKTLEKANEIESALRSTPSSDAACGILKPSASLPGLTRGFSGDGADCTSFIRPDGTYGSWGKTIIDRLNGGRFPRFTNAKSPPVGIQSCCPNYRSFRKRELQHFWVWVFTAIAHDESTCRTSAEAKGSNDRAVGLLQMEKGYRMRFWRGTECQAKNIKTAAANLSCGMRILHEQLLGKNGDYRSSGRIYPGEPSYWEKLNSKSEYPDGGDIGRLIRQFPLCR